MPIICFSLHTCFKSSTIPAIMKQNCYQLLNVYDNFVHIYTDGSKEGNHIAAAMINKYSFVVTAHLPDNSSIFSTEAHAFILAHKFIETHDSSRFVIFCDSLSCLQAINNAKLTNPLVQCILKKYHVMFLTGKLIHFSWIPSRIGITGNERGCGS